MQGKRRLRLRDLEQSLVQHQRRAAALAFRHAFLCRLKHEQHLAGQPFAELDQHLGDPHQDGGVGVVAAGMHDADRAAAEFAGRRRTERQVGLFRDRQCVHVGAQQDRRSREASLDDGDHTRVSDAGAHLESERAQELGDLRGRAGLAVCELRVAVKIPAPLDDPPFDRGGRGVEFCVGYGRQGPLCDGK